MAAEYGVAKSTMLGILGASIAVVRRQPLGVSILAEAVRLYVSLSQIAT